MLDITVLEAMVAGGCDNVGDGGGRGHVGVVGMLGKLLARIGLFDLNRSIT